MKTYPFTRPTIIAAIEFLGSTLTQAKFDQVIVRLGLDDDIALASPKSVTAKSALLAQAITQRAADVVSTVNGQMTLAEAAVRIAVEVSVTAYPKPEQAPFLRGLALDGYVVSWDEDSRIPLLRAALPGEVDLPATDDEAHQLLKHFSFTVPLGHLDQAIEAHTRGDWAAANSQVRSFLEGLLSDISLHIEPETASSKLSFENRRTHLVTRKFLSVERNECTNDGKGYIPGLFKMLHTDGSHPGLSDEDHSTFRLHLALVTGRMLLRRLYNEK
ncbi:UNVERIFIED_ORG: hypothetical protein M2402_004290 [Rahnella aquatilis]